MDNVWKAVILIGGPDKGTRFRPLSLDIPKPLFPVGGLPMVEHHIRTCSKVEEIKQVLLIGFYPMDEMRTFVEDMRRKYSISIRYLMEFTRLGTAGGIYHFRDQIRQDGTTGFFVVNCDVCCNFPLKDMIKFHKQKVGFSDGVTIITTEITREESMSYGCVVKNPDTHGVLHFVEKPETFLSTLINCGAYVMSIKVLEHLQHLQQQRQLNAHEDEMDGLHNEIEYISLEKDILVPYTTSEKMFAFTLKQPWSQIKSAASVIYANKLYLSSSDENDSKHQDQVFIHETAKVSPTAILGPNVSIGENVIVEDGVRVKNSIVLKGALLKKHCCILNSVIGWESAIGYWSRVEGTSQSPNPNVEHANIVSGGLFNKQGKLCPSITVLGRKVNVANEIVVLNSIVLPNKDINNNSKNQIIL